MNNNPPPAVLGSLVLGLFTVFWFSSCLLCRPLCPHTAATLDCDYVFGVRRAISKLPLVSHFRRQQHIGRQRLRVLAASSGPRAHQSSAPAKAHGWTQVGLVLLRIPPIGSWFYPHRTCRRGGCARGTQLHLLKTQTQRACCARAAVKLALNIQTSSFPPLGLRPFTMVHPNLSM